MYMYKLMMKYGGPWTCKTGKCTCICYAMHGYHPPKLGRVIIIVMLHAGVKGVSERGELTPFTPACNTGLTKINDQHNTVIIIIIILLSENENYYSVFRLQ